MWCYFFVVVFVCGGILKITFIRTFPFSAHSIFSLIFRSLTSLFFDRENNILYTEKCYNIKFLICRRRRTFIFNELRKKSCVAFQMFQTLNMLARLYFDMAQSVNANIIFDMYAIFFLSFSLSCYKLRQRLWC